jgi:DNA polymerase-1
MTILFIDGHNLMYRARSGFQLGDFNVIFNFFRGLKALVAQFKPTRLYFTLEGHPKHRHQLFEDYKANRHVILDPAKPADVKKARADDDYRRQQGLIVDLLRAHFPVSVMRQPDYEADDLIANVIGNASSAAQFVVVSSDTDFIQLLQQHANVRLYNPVAKSFLQAPVDYDYVTWKALRGDGSDNIPGLPGIGDKRAQEMATDVEALAECLRAEPTAAAFFNRNVQLIQFARWTEDELLAMTSSSPVRDWDAVKASFSAWGFNSMLKEPYWSTFVAAFDSLWCVDGKGTDDV